MNNNSIFEYIKSNIVDGELPRYFSLPKEDDDIVFEDGAKDGIYIYHMTPQNILDEEYNLMIDAINHASDHEFDKASELFVLLSKSVPAIAISNTMQDYIRENADYLDAGNIYEYVMDLIRSSNNIECIKYALIILELLDTDYDDIKNDIKLLALSNEFTCYCIYIMKTWNEGNFDIFEIAKKVHGWGRIFAVEELRALDPKYDEIQNWLLKEGIKNDVMSSYSALSVWRNSSAGSILFTNPTYEQFTYIRNIIDALLDESAVFGLSMLDKRNDIIKMFFTKAAKMPLQIDDYIVIYNIYNYYEDLEDSFAIRTIAKKILSSLDAKKIIKEAVKKGKGIELAIEVGIDVKEDVLALIKSSFIDNCHLCSYLMNDDVYRKQLLAIYHDNLPLKQMISAPSLELGLLPEFENEDALEFLLQELKDYPMQGIEFVEAGLQCRPIRTRNFALNALQNWVSIKQIPLADLLPDMHSLLIMLSSFEPDEDLKEKMESLIAKNISFVSKIIDNNTLDILSDAISDVGSWSWWHVDDRIVQLEFSDVELYDFSKEEKAAHSSIIALQFSINDFAIFLDNADSSDKKKWFDKLHDDELSAFSIENGEFVFNDSNYIGDILESYKNKTTIKDISDNVMVNCKYILACKCFDYAFIVGGNKLRVLTHQGELYPNDIEEASRRWWQYWQDYHDKRNSEDSYEKDYACEVTIPIQRS